MFSGIQQPTPLTVFNLQALDWVQCEEETGAYYQLSRLTYKLVSFNFFIFKVASFAHKNMLISKNFIKFIIHLKKKDNWAYIYMY